MAANEEKKDPLTLVNNLHSTLDVNKILEIFYNHLKNIITFDGLSYHNAHIKTHYFMGETSQCQFNFNLSIDEMDLGEFILSRQSQFNDHEIGILEEQLCFLINPLRNAITHYEALHAALHDPLTRLLNRGSLNNTLQREMKMYERSQSPLSLIVMDIDDFKQINDQLGHLVGDDVLRAVADIISQTIRETDVAFRIGGEEFLVLMTNTDINGANTLAERLREQVESCHISHKGQTVNFTVSLGIAQYRENETQHELIARADQAMYQAKRTGKNKVICELIPSD
jgi:diguanylate cyclase (GGDEF)-like protein